MSSSRLVLNVSPIEFADAQVRVGRFPYQAAEQLRELRTAHDTTHVFLRDDNSILAVPFVEDAPELGESFEAVSLSANLRLAALLVRNALLNYFNGMGRRVYSRRPLRVASGRRHDLLSASIPRGLKGPKWLSVLPLYEADVRVFDFDHQEPFVGLALDVRTRQDIAASCAELLELGLSLTGLYVGHRVPGTDSRLQPHLSLVGRVVRVDGAILQLDDNVPEVSSVEASDAYLEPRIESFDRCLSLSLGRRADEVKRRLSGNVATVRTGPERLKRLRAVVEHLSSENLQLVPGVGFHARPFLSSQASSQFPTLEVAPKPVYVFDPTGAHTDSWHDRGLNEHGPYTAQTFDKNTPRICVVCQASRRGQVDEFLGKFLNGIPQPSVQKAWYRTGLLRKYGLKGADTRFFEARGPTATAYQKAAQEAIAAQDERWDLALVQTERRFRELSGPENPYLVSKREFLTHQIPVQGFTVELMNFPESQLAPSLNNMALATYAKLGGIPWLLKGNPTWTNELVVGIGSANVGEGRLGGRERVVGITTVFTSDGKYWLSNATRSVPFEDYKDALVSALRKAISQLQRDWQPGEHVRLVFHAFKSFKGVEAQAVMDLMAELGDYDVDFAFLHVVDDSRFLVFDEQQRGVRDHRARTTKGAFAPQRGGYLRLSDTEILLSLTGPRDVKRPEHGLPSPVLLRLHRDSTFTDTTYLARQAYSFACHSWRSFFPASLPVTILYSELIARLLGKLNSLPRWNPDIMIGRVGRTRWFL